MSRPLQQPRPDPFSDEPFVKPVRSQTRYAGGIPGTLIMASCLAMDLVLFGLSGVYRKLVTSELGEPMALGVLYGILTAQFAMAAIWLGIMITALYWMLLGLIVFCFAALALLPATGAWPTLLILAWGCLMFTFPFALVRMAGFRIELQPDSIASDVAREPIRFPLSRLFGWTFVVAAILGVSQALPAAVAPRLARLLLFFVVALIGLATLWATLWPGPMRRRRLIAPAACSAISVFFGQKAFDLKATDTVGVATAGLLYILTLAGLLAFYRAAGWRLVSGSGRGWLVR